MGIVSDFLGKTGKKQALATQQYNLGQSQAGYDAKKGYVNTGYDTATGRLQPYEAQGRAGQTAYTNALGINGDAGRQSALGMYGRGNNPWLDESMGLAMRAGDRRAAAVGQYGAGAGPSGVNALARARVAAQMGGDDYNNWLARLQGVGQQGMGAAGAMANLDTGRAGALVNNEDAFRRGNMGIQNKYAQDYGQATTAGLNNVMGLAGAGMQIAQMAMGMPPMGTNFFGSQGNPVGSPGFGGPGMSTRLPYTDARGYGVG